MMIASRVTPCASLSIRYTLATLSVYTRYTRSPCNNDLRLVVPEGDLSHLDALSPVLFLGEAEDRRREVGLQLLVRIVDAQLRRWGVTVAGGDSCGVTVSG